MYSINREYKYIDNTYTQCIQLENIYRVMYEVACIYSNIRIYRYM